MAYESWSKLRNGVKVTGQMLRLDLVDVGAGSKGTVVVAERFIIS